MAEDKDIEVTEEAPEEETSLRDDILSAAGEDENETEEEVETTEEAEAEVQAEAEPAEEPPETDTEIKPPVDWSPEMAAKWGKLDPDVKNQITERERHVNKVLQESADSRHAVDTFNQMIQPYAPMMQAEGVTDPLQAVHGLLQTTSKLMMGTPQQKAQTIAGLIEHYGVDIATLDNALTGEPTVDPAVNQFNQVLDQRLAPLQQLLDRVNQTDQQAAQHSQAEATQTIQQFAADPKNKYFEHVRNEMADQIEIALGHGRQLTMEQAYQSACMANPQVAPMMMKDMADAAAQGGIKAAEAAETASSSVFGTPTGGSVNEIDENMTLRETIASQVAGGGRIG